MIPPHLLPHTVQRIRPNITTDTHGDQKLEYAVPPATSADMAAWMQQDSGKESRDDGREPQERDWLLITNDQDIQGRDRIVFGSLTFDVEGPPAPVYTPGGYHHTESTLRKVDG